MDDFYTKAERLLDLISQVSDRLPDSGEELPLKLREDGEIELTRTVTPFGREILSLLCLPISPPRHVCCCSSLFSELQTRPPLCLKYL
jgi:hypothetical protein